MKKLSFHTNSGDTLRSTAETKDGAYRRATIVYRAVEVGRHSLWPELKADDKQPTVSATPIPPAQTEQLATNAVQGALKSDFAQTTTLEVIRERIDNLAEPGNKL